MEWKLSELYSFFQFVASLKSLALIGSIILTGSLQDKSPLQMLNYQNGKKLLYWPVQKTT